MLRSLLPLLTFVVLLAAPASATWSIVLVNLRTGEVAVASATCIPGFDLAQYVPVIVVGHGAAAAQSYVDPSGQNRIYIRDQLLLGTDPAQILAGLAQRDPSHQTRQYGIVDIQGGAVGFSGTGAGGYAGDRIGRAGDIVYAIQGNVLTGGAVLAAAELAIYNTPGDMGEKLMAAMEAAASFGGDGRCSCTGPTPTSCGAPPPGFRKSADVGCMIMARLGDVDGTCGSNGCANGSYYMRLNVANQPSQAVDPVVQLRSRFEAWKLSQVGRPDHYLSTASLSAPSLPIDGQTMASIVLVLRDRAGDRLTTGGATVQVSIDPASTTTVPLGPVRDNGDGSYDIPVTAPATFGRVLLNLTVDDGRGTRVLAPAYDLPISRDPLWVDLSEVSATAGATLRFTLQPGRFLGRNHLWVLLASMSGTQPGLRIPPSSFVLPLNPDALFMATVNAAFSGLMPELLGVTSAAAISHTSIVFPPGMYTLPVGTDLSFAYALLNPTTLTSNAVTVRIVQ